MLKAGGINDWLIGLIENLGQEISFNYLFTSAIDK